MICLVGFELYKEIVINFMGLRPGEKMFEELLLDADSVTSTKRDKIFIEHPIQHSIDRTNLLDLTYVQTLLQSILERGTS